jgi:hypothetical protein
MLPETQFTTEEIQTLESICQYYQYGKLDLTSPLLAHMLALRCTTETYQNTADKHIVIPANPTLAEKLFNLAFNIISKITEDQTVLLDQNQKTSLSLCKSELAKHYLNNNDFAKAKKLFDDMFTIDNDTGYSLNALNTLLSEFRDQCNSSKLEKDYQKYRWLCEFIITRQYSVHSVTLLANHCLASKYFVIQDLPKPSEPSEPSRAAEKKDAFPKEGNDFLVKKAPESSKAIEKKDDFSKKENEFLIKIALAFFLIEKINGKSGVSQVARIFNELLTTTKFISKNDKDLLIEGFTLFAVFHTTIEVKQDIKKAAQLLESALVHSTLAEKQDIELQKKLLKDLNYLAYACFNGSERIKMNLRTAKYAYGCIGFFPIKIPTNKLQTPAKQEDIEDRKEIIRDARFLYETTCMTLEGTPQEQKADYSSAFAFLMCTHHRAGAVSPARLLSIFIIHDIVNLVITPKARQQVRAQLATEKPEKAKEAASGARRCSIM